uniref:Ubiquitinyl hydrolase 1 n=1 Tax=Strongyloides papillosus TaxID=174720 RepID=A0A0N5BCW2_STREA
MASKIKESGSEEYINDRNILNPFFYRLALCFYQQSYIKSVLEQYRGNEEIEKMRREVYEFYMQKLAKLKRYSQIELEKHDPDVCGLSLVNFEAMTKILNSRHPRDVVWEDHTLLDGYQDMLYMISNLTFKTLLDEMIRDVDSTVETHNTSFPAWKIFAVNDGNESHAEDEVYLEVALKVKQRKLGKLGENIENDGVCRNDDINKQNDK